MWEILGKLWLQLLAGVQEEEQRWCNRNCHAVAPKAMVAQPRPANPLMRFQLWCQNIAKTDFQRFSAVIESFHIAFCFPAVNQSPDDDHGPGQKVEKRRNSSFHFLTKCFVQGVRPKICDFASLHSRPPALIEMSKSRINFGGAARIPSHGQRRCKSRAGSKVQIYITECQTACQKSQVIS